MDENGNRYYWDTLARDGLQNPIPVKLKSAIREFCYQNKIKIGISIKYSDTFLFLFAI